MGLDLDRHWFLNKIDDHQSPLRLLNYPHQDHYLEGRTRASEHSDYGIIMILKQDGVAGLQVRRDNISAEKTNETPTYEWIDVISQPYCFVLNLVDLMQRYTNDKWKSTVPRVISPAAPAPGISNRHQSCAFFFNANVDCVVDTFASCRDENGETKYKPVIAGEYLMAKHSKAMQHDKE